MIGARELIELAGITYRQFDYWNRKGWLTPINDAKGSGNYREYDAAQFRIAVTMAQLVKAGMDPEQARKLCEPLIGDGHVKLGPFLLVRVAA